MMEILCDGNAVLSQHCCAILESVVWWSAVLYNGVLCDGNSVVECCAMEIVCDGGEEVDETALLRLLALSCNQTLLIILPLHFTYLEYSLFTHIVTLQ